MFTQAEQKRGVRNRLYPPAAAAAPHTWQGGTPSAPSIRALCNAQAEGQHAAGVPRGVITSSNSNQKRTVLHPWPRRRVTPTGAANRETDESSF